MNPAWQASRALLTPFRVRTLENAERAGRLYAAGVGHEDLSVEWEGPKRGMALVVVGPDGSTAECGS